MWFEQQELRSSSIRNRIYVTTSSNETKEQFKILASNVGIIQNMYSASSRKEPCRVPGPWCYEWLAASDSAPLLSDRTLRNYFWALASTGRRQACIKAYSDIPFDSWFGESDRCIYGSLSRDRGVRLIHSSFVMPVLVWRAASGIEIFFNPKNVLTWWTKDECGQKSEEQRRLVWWLNREL